MFKWSMSIICNNIFIHPIIVGNRNKNNNNNKENASLVSQILRALGRPVAITIILYITITYCVCSTILLCSSVCDDQSWMTI